MTPLHGHNKVAYAMAQGPLAVGGYKFEQRGTSAQKNYPTAGTIPGGAIVERRSSPSSCSDTGALELLLDEPDYTTATRIAAAINADLPGGRGHRGRRRPGARVARQPERPPAVASWRASSRSPWIPTAARVVVNERTGTVVSGGDVHLSAVTVTHGDLKVSIVERYLVSQPEASAAAGARGAHRGGARGDRQRRPRRGEGHQPPPAAPPSPTW